MRQKNLTLLIAVLSLLFVHFSQSEANAQAFNDPSDRFSVGLNVGVLPTAEIGFGINESVSLHVKGTYIPNVFTSPNHFETWFVAPVLRFWQSDDNGYTERFRGFYAEAGIPFVNFNMYSEKLLGTERPGIIGWSLGANLGVGYSFKVTEHLRITPNLNVMLLVAPQVEYYKCQQNENNLPVQEAVLGPAIPGLIIPLEVGVRFDLVY